MKNKNPIDELHEIVQRCYDINDLLIKKSATGYTGVMAQLIGAAWAILRINDVASKADPNYRPLTEEEYMLYAKSAWDNANSLEATRLQLAEEKKSAN